MKSRILSIAVVFLTVVSSVFAEGLDTLDYGSITIVAKKDISYAPAFKTKELDTAILGHEYSCQVKAECKLPEFEMEASGLPYGLELNEDGTIKGKAYLDGVYKVYVKAKTKYHETIKGYNLVVDVEKHHRKYYYLSKGIDTYPNHFEDLLNVEYNLNDQYMVTVKIYSKEGDLIKTLVENEVQEGSQKFVWEGLNNAGRKVRDGYYVVVFEFMDRNDELIIEERKVLRSHIDSRYAFYNF